MPSWHEEGCILLSIKHNTFLLLVNANNHQPLILSSYPFTWRQAYSYSIKADWLSGKMNTGGEEGDIKYSAVGGREGLCPNCVTCSVPFPTVHSSVAHITLCYLGSKYQRMCETWGKLNKTHMAKFTSLWLQIWWKQWASSCCLLQVILHHIIMQL